MAMVRVDAAELSGSWTSTTPGSGIVGTWTVNLVQNGQTIEGYITSLSANLQQEYGFNIGDKAIYGTFDGTTYRGKVLLHFSVSLKHCSNWNVWGDFTLVIDSNGNSLSGERAVVGSLYNNCSFVPTNQTTSLIFSKNVESVANCSNSPSVTISSDLSMHIPKATYQPTFGSPMDLWADFQFVQGTDGSLMWRLSNYGLNQ